ncbi:hypothetical protein [Pelagibacterium sediminicola]|uniref:hypothetical protein n=1 Tax=Pelagibacterium sediminicola TaxID=2248761 RepID=UPI000E31131A|nr:hypothetical protein [Pelagibacterium sediminicola]
MALVATSWLPAIFPRAGLFFLENQSSSGGVSILGNEQVVVAPSSRWRAQFSMPVVTETSVLAWRAFVAGMGGRAGTVLVPKWEAYGPRDANGRRFEELATALYGDDALFKDGTNFDLSGFAQDDTPVYASLSAPAALNATQIAVEYGPGIDGLRPGQYFSIGHRLYVVTQAWQEADGAPTQIRFSPWLREDVEQGTPVIIDRPVCLMRFAQDATGELELDLGRWGQGQLEFVESF